MLKEDAEDDGNDDYLEPLERIHGASKHLLNLINDAHLLITMSGCKQLSPCLSGVSRLKL